MRKYLTGLFIAVIVFIPFLGISQTAITIEGDIAKTISFTKQDLNAMNKVQVHVTDMAGKAHDFSGVPIADVFKAAGIFKPEHQRDNVTGYALVRSSDNYEVLFSLSELDSAFSNRIVLLADSMDGKPLPEAKGPYRIVVTGEEKRQARWIWGVNTFIIRYSKD